MKKSELIFFELVPKVLEFEKNLKSVKVLTKEFKFFF
jgi:hypothetical protein